MPILDSDILIASLKGEKEAIEFLMKLKSEGIALSSTVINSFELLEGALRYGDPKKIMEVESVLNSLNIYGFTLPVSRIAAKISCHLKKKGNIIDFQDISIASISILNNEELITRNIQHFKRIDGLKIRKW